MFERILELCNQHSITVAVLETKLGFGKCTISKWKVSSPSVVKLEKVADYFGVTVDYLLKG